MTVASRLVAKARSALGFGLVGTSGVVVNQTIMWLLVARFHVNYVLAGAIATVGSTSSNFLLTEFLVFTSRARTGFVKRYVGFSALSVASLPLRLPVLFVLTSLLSVHYLISNLVALGVTFLARFLVSDQLIWQTPVPVTQEVVDL
jgi:dolichol-phosphate mannosyltransferase